MGYTWNDELLGWHKECRVFKGRTDLGSKLKSRTEKEARGWGWPERAWAAQSYRISFKHSCLTVCIWKIPDPLSRPSFLVY